MRAYVGTTRHQTPPVEAVYVLGDMLGHEAVLVALCDEFGTKMTVAPQCNLRRRQLEVLDTTRELLAGAIRGIFGLRTHERGQKTTR